MNDHQRLETSTPPATMTTDDDDEDEREREEEEEKEELSTTRLNLRYATAHGVHSPFRHVRTRLYFTSE